MSNVLKNASGNNEAERFSLSEQRAENTDALEIDLIALLYRLLEKAKFIIAAAILGAVIAGVVAVFFTTPTYTATSKLYVLNTSSAAINVADIQIGTYLTKDYSEVFNNWHVHEMVLEELDLPYSYGKLKSGLKVSNPENTRVLALSYTSTDPQEAKLIADTYAQKAREFIATVMDTTMPNIFEEALVPSSPSSRGKKETVIIGFMLGFLLACALFTVQFIVDDRIFNGEDIEKYLGLHVLGIMPVISFKGSSARKTERKE